MKHHAPGPEGWEGTSTNVMGDIAYTIKANPNMHVLLMGGYFDLGTLYFGATYEMKHLPIPQNLEKNIEYSGLIFQTVWGLITRQTSPRQLMGPVAIAQLSMTAAAAPRRPRQNAASASCRRTSSAH